jgi:SAM-dependent methyltransferase
MSDSSIRRQGERVRRRLRKAFAPAPAPVPAPSTEAPVALPSESRVEKILAGLDTSRPGLEVGPFHSPITPKRDGYSVEVMDFLDTEGLRSHYASAAVHDVDLDAVEEVDHVWRGEPLTELVGGPARYDWVIASHVVEHIPDLVSFLRGVSEILTPGGRLSLAVPDKRYCFDHYSPLTTTGQLLDAYLERRVRPSPGQAFDYFARCSQLDGAIAWAPDLSGTPGFHHDITMAGDGWRSSIDGEDFAGELHVWRFTPESFRLIITELDTIGLLDLDIVDSRPTAGSEFFVTLGHGSICVTEDERLALVRAAVDSDRAD